MRRIALAAVLAMAVPHVAHAEDEIARGAVVKIEAQEIYISIGAGKGISDGARLRLKRPVSLRHPVTRALVQDWIPIGSASITQAGSVMSRAVVHDLAAAIQVGDIAEVLVVGAEAAPPTPQPAAPQPKRSRDADPATAEVLGLFAAQAGQPIDARIAAWERYLSMRGNSPYAAAIRSDLDQLHELREAMRTPRTARPSATVVRVDHAPPATAIAGSEIQLVFVLADPARVASAYLHYRPRGNRTYRSVLLVREHDVYLRGTLPAEVVAPPGVDYFVEVSTPAGESGLAVGTPRAPMAIEVSRPTVLEHFGSAPGRSSVKLAADYLSFASFDRRDGDRADTLITANVDFTYRLDSWVESVGVGYGVYAGRGGFANVVWTDAMPLPRSGFHYGYADIEVGGEPLADTGKSVHFSLGGQLIAGVGKEGFGLGAEGRLRIGHRDATNLAFVARTVEDVGFLSDIRFGTRPLSGLLVGVSVGATNQPNRGDVGVKLGTELEIIAIDNVSVILRGSWQGRSTKHGGIGGGGGLGFYW